MLSLLATLFGFMSSFAPNILDFFKEGRDMKHELQMMDKEQELMDRKAELNLEQIQVESETSINELEIKSENDSVVFAHKSSQSLKPAQWVDNIRALTRPILTFWFMSLYTFSKVSIFTGAMKGGLPWPEAGQLMFTEYDLALLATVIGFWFGDRVKKYLKK